MPLLQSLLELITSQPGAMVYQLVTLFAIQLILGVAVGHWQRRRDEASARLLAMGAGFFLARAILMLVALLARVGLLSSNVLPPLERCLDFATMVLVAWAFLPVLDLNPRLSNRLLVVAVLGAAAAYAAFANLWPGAEALGLPYNGFWQERVWAVVTTAAVALALVAAIAWRGADWGWLVCLLGLWLAGHGLQLVAPVADANSAGWVRLANLAALPLLAALVYRRALGATSPRLEESEEMALGVVGMLKAIQRIEDDGRVESALELAASAIARTVSADMVAIGLRVPEAPDALRVVALHPATSITLANQETTLLVSRYPLLSTALQSRHLERAIVDPQVTRVSSLYRSLGFNAAGPLLVQPLTVGEEVLGVVLAGNPDSQREWLTHGEQILQALGAPLASAIAGRQRRERVLNRELEGARLEIRAMAERAGQLEAELENQRLNTEDLLVQLHQREGGVVQLEEAKVAVATAQEEAAKSAESHSALLTLLSHWQDEAQRLGEANAKLEEQLAQLALTESTGGRLEGAAIQSEMVASLVEELRTPMTSIVDNTDVLLGERAVVLGESQRQSLLRVKANTERMEGLLNDLVTATDVETGQIELVPEPLDVAEVLDTVLKALSARFDEKALSVRSDLEPDLPPVHGDRGSLHQAVLKLVSNAALASEPGTAVRLCAGVQEPPNELEDLPAYLLVSITDTGGGIKPEDHRDVFRRFYPSDRPPVEGLGDTGVGLAVARALIEANGGRIWVESEAGVGSTFNFILPLSSASDGQE